MGVWYRGGVCGIEGVYVVQEMFTLGGGGGGSALGVSRQIPSPERATSAVGTHPAGMHSRCEIGRIFSKSDMPYFWNISPSCTL